jgi:hypothetical protein
MTKPSSVIEIDPKKLRVWEKRFRFYREPPDEQKIQTWIGQFSIEHYGLAQKLLDDVEIVSERQIQAGYKQLAARIPNWLSFVSNGNSGHGRFVVVGFGRAGESGPAMVRSFRDATGLTNSSYDSHFCSITDLPSLGLSALDTVVFVDDFAGTGKQISEKWPVIEELIASQAKCFLLLTAMTEAAKISLKAIKKLKVLATQTLTSDKNILSDSCTSFSAVEKKDIIKYCKRADRKNPKGWGDCGLLFILSHKTPNNSLPILHCNHGSWNGLFPRYLRA